MKRPRPKEWISKAWASQVWTTQTTLWVCLLLSALGHGMLVYWLEYPAAPPVVDGLDHAAIEISLASNSGTDEVQTEIEEKSSESVSDSAEDVVEIQTASAGLNRSLRNEQSMAYPASVPTAAEPVVPENINGQESLPVKIDKQPVVQEITAVAVPAHVAKPEPMPLTTEAPAKPTSRPLLFAEPPGRENEFPKKTQPPATQQSSLTPPPRYTLGMPLTPHPEYPGVAIRRGWQGEVIIALTVSPTGKVLLATVAESSGFGLLDRAALKTLQDWQLSAAVSEEKILVPVRFELH